MALSDGRRKAISKFLSLVLRHNPSAAGITLDAAGWVSVPVLIEGCAAAGRAFTREDLDEVVRTNDKQRFAFSEDGTKIRASQGHSIQVDLGYEPQPPPSALYHGTAKQSVASILATGLEKVTRQHVHLSETVTTATKVGARHGEPVVLTIDAERMAADGHSFYRSANGVWLTDAVPSKYISQNLA